MYDAIVNNILTSTLKEKTLADVPILMWSEHALQLTVTLVCRQRKNASKFFYDMISRWLIPGKSLNIILHFSTLYEEKKKTYVVSQLVLNLESVQDLAHAKRNLPFLEKEILLGANSFYHATKILEMKGLNLDDKTSLIQEKIAKLIQRFPKGFDYDIFTEMQQLLVSSKETFKAAHQPSEMSRMIFTLYRFRKELAERMAKDAKRRHLCLKFKRTLLHTPFGHKEVLSVFGGLNFLKEHELFEERHFLSAFSHFIPGVQTIPGSYYAVEDADEQIQVFYLEIEKSIQQPFAQKELVQLKQNLPGEIFGRIEQLVPPIFMPRNEEEVMRNILILSEQLKYAKDIPQMIIIFDEQTDAELSFTVILVRRNHPNSLSIRELFQSSPLAPNLSFDRIKMVGRLRRKIPKEASVMRVRLSSETFMRDDYSVDLFAARFQLLKEIQSVIGEVRDYNGGIISKQGENFALLKKKLGKISAKHPLLLQNFFHSIFPVQFSATLDPQLLKILFSQLLEAVMSRKESVSFKAKRASDYLFVMAKFQDFTSKQKVFKQIESFKIPSNELLSVQMQILDASYLGFIYLNPNKAQQTAFLEAIPDALMV